MTSHTKKWKEAQLQELQKLADQYPVIAIASLTGFPGALAKELRKKLQGKAVVKVSKTRVFERALKQSNKETKELLEHLKGSVAVIFTEMNPFELYAFLKKNKVNMPAKSGIIAPDDIMVPAGDTGLPPGPALSDLKAAGLKTVMQGPTISIAENKVVSKKGEVITEAVAGALSKLGIKPVKVGLNITACFEKGQIFLAQVLDIDIDQVRAQFATASANALNLAVEIAYLTKYTAEILIAKGYKNAKAVALEANILNSATVSGVLAKATRQATALKEKVPESAPPEKSEEKKEEPKAGEKPAEEKAGEKPAEEKLAEEKSAEEKVGEKPAEEKLAEEKSAEEKAGEKPAEEKPVEEKAAEEKAEEKKE